MKSKQFVTAVLAAAGLLWGSAQAAPEDMQGAQEAPEIIILEMPALPPGVAIDEQTLLSMLLLQLLTGGIQIETDNVEMQAPVAPLLGQQGI